MFFELNRRKNYIFNKDNIIVRKKQPTLWMEDLNNIVNKKALIRQVDRLSDKGNNLTDEELSELILSDVEEIKLNN